MHFIFEGIILVTLIPILLGYLILFAPLLLVILGSILSVGLSTYSVNTLFHTGTVSSFERKRIITLMNRRLAEIESPSESWCNAITKNGKIDLFVTFKSNGKVWSRHVRAISLHEAINRMNGKLLNTAHFPKDYGIKNGTSYSRNAAMGEDNPNQQIARVFVA